MHQSIIIIEDFYDDPKAIRDLALGQSFKSHNSATYPGANSTGALFNEEISAKINAITGEQLEPMPSMANGVFRTSPASSTHKQDIHIDPGADWAGVLFLNLPHQCKGGTYFWKHKEYGFEWCPRTPEEGAQYGFKSYEEIQKKIIYGDGLDRSKWDLTVNTNMRFNRLVLFRPWMWHSHGENFGTTKFDSRLVQVFFLRNVQQITMPTVNVLEQVDPVQKAIQDFEHYHANKQAILQKDLPGTENNPLVTRKYFYE